MTTNWTKINKASGTSWAKISKPSLSTPTITGGDPIGLLLALTYSSITQVSNWIKISKASGTAWTKITKAT